MKEREEELRRIIQEKVNDCSEKKWMRVKRTFLVLSGAVYLNVLYYGLDHGEFGIKDFLMWLLASPVVAGFIMLISYGVLCYILTDSTEEEKTIARLVGKLEGIEEVKRSEKD